MCACVCDKGEEFWLKCDEDVWAVTSKGRKTEAEEKREIDTEWNGYWKQMNTFRMQCKITIARSHNELSK